MFRMRRPSGYTPHHIYYDPQGERMRYLMRKAEGKTRDDDVLQSFPTHWAEQTRNLRCRKYNKTAGHLILLLLLAVIIGFLLIY